MLFVVADLTFVMGSGSYVVALRPLVIAGLDPAIPENTVRNRLAAQFFWRNGRVTP
jgi:hypothetical protein